jgi:uncharacterized protein YjbI with pentapeptide repeats
LIFRTNKAVWIVLSILIISGIATGFVSWFVNYGYVQGNFPTWLAGFFQNFSTELFGALMTFGLIEIFLNVERRKEEAIQRKKEKLLSQLTSDQPAIARYAVQEFKRNNWLDELQGKNLIGSQWSNEDLTGLDLTETVLWKADLTSAILEKANLARAELAGANLQQVQAHDVVLRNANLEGAMLNGANLVGANLAGANLRGACLKDAILNNTDLTGVDLTDADLTGCYLVEAKLQRAILGGANLCGAYMDNASGIMTVLPSAQTILPDNTYYVPGTNLERYINRERDDFIKPSLDCKQSDGKEVSPEAN